MWDPITYVPRERGYIEADFSHYFVTCNGISASNWQELEKEAQEVALGHSWSGDNGPYYPLTWELLKKADFPLREQGKAQETYLTGDGQGRFFVRHLEYGKPTDDWREIETYIAHDVEEGRYIVENKDGLALNWETLEPEARAAVEQMEEECQNQYIVACPPELAKKARFLSMEEIEIDTFPWDNGQAFVVKIERTPDFDYGR